MPPSLFGIGFIAVIFAVIGAGIVSGAVEELIDGWEWGEDE